MIKIENKIEFIEQYEQIYDYVQLDEKKDYIGDKKKCRFCGKDKPEVSFKKKAHTIPEMLGNKIFFSNDECDICNKFFGENLEDSFSKYLGMWRIISQIDGKNGVPSYKTKEKIERVDYTNLGVEFKTYENSKWITINEENNEILISHELEPYTPIAVYKCLVKISLSFLPNNELENFKETIEWLKEPTHTNSKYNMDKYVKNLSVRFVPGPVQLPVHARGYIRKHEISRIPYYIFILEFGNHSYQISVPCTLKDKWNDTTTHDITTWYALRYSKYGEIEYKREDMSLKEKLKDSVQSIPLHFEIIEEKDIK